MKYYSYLFYKFYSFFLKIGKGDDPEFKAIIFLSLWNILYFVTVLIGLGGIIGFRSHDSSYDEIIGVGVSLLIVAINYSLFFKKKRYQKIKERYDKSQPVSRVQSRLLMFVFLITPFIVLGFILLSTNIIIN